MAQITTSDPLYQKDPLWAPNPYHLQDSVNQIGQVAASQSPQYAGYTAGSAMPPAEAIAKWNAYQAALQNGTATDVTYSGAGGITGQQILDAANNPQKLQALGTAPGIQADANSAALNKQLTPQSATTTQPTAPNTTQAAPTTPVVDPKVQQGFNAQYNPNNVPLSQLYMTPKYASEEAARRAGYTGPFAGGGANAWLATASPEQKIKYYEEIKKLGAGMDASGNITSNPEISAEQITSQSAKDVLTYMQQLPQNPILPTGTSLVPELQSVQNNELLSQGNINSTNTSAPVVNGNVPINQTTAQAGQINQQDVMARLDPVTGQWIPILGDNAAQGTAAQGTVSPLATVKGQLEALYGELQNGQTPPWAQGAVTKAEQILADRGLGTSTIGASAIAAAIQESAINIAAPDAASYFNMDMANLSNRQQMELENLKNRQQGLLTDQSLRNAAEQFNATSKQQSEQFAASLVKDIQGFNANLLTTTSQFNSSEANKIATQLASNTIAVDTFNSQQQKAVNDFNSNLAFQRDTFNANMQYAIQQSNALWRRSINTQNTAAINAANETNVQNAFNLSSVALNNLWQAFRDEAAWAFTSSESAADRAFNAAMAANNRQFADEQDDFNWASAAGSFAMNLLGNALK